MAYTDRGSGLQDMWIVGWRAFFRFWGTGLYRSIGHVAFGLEAVRVYGLHGSGFKATDRGFANRGLKASGLCRSIGHVAFAGFHGSGLRFGV